MSRAAMTVLRRAPTTPERGMAYLPSSSCLKRFVCRTLLGTPPLEGELNVYVNAAFHPAEPRELWTLAYAFVERLLP